MRIPLREGTKTPKTCERMLGRLGRAPNGDPLFRIIWSDRKMVYFAGEIVQEARYQIFERPCWVLEAWTEPRKDAGPKALWDETMEFLMGPYPSEGTYNFVVAFDKDWTPHDSLAVQTICTAIEESKHIAYEKRLEAIKEGLQEKERDGVMATAEAIEELYDSAALGKIQQPARGAKNNFRTVDDYERDQWKVQEIPDMPKSGGKIVRDI